MNYAETLTTFTPKTIKKRKCELFDLPLTFDTETSHNHNPQNPLAWVYSWALCIDASKELAIFGRDVFEFMQVLKDIEKHLSELSRKYNACYKVVMYAHNAPYDYAYIYQILKQNFTIKREFFLDRRHVISVDIGEHIILKDSLVYFNNSLENVCNTYDVRHKKLVGVVDYSAIHYSTDELTQNDIDYQLNDVYGLQESLLKDWELNGYNIATAPLTSTGKIRNECRIDAYTTDGYRKDFLYTIPTPRKFIYMRKTFAGGYCHGNRFLRGITIFDYIKHRDFRSHYPSVMRKYKFPSGRIIEIKNPTLQDFNTDGFCVWGVVGFEGLELKSKKTLAPYLSRSKCESKKGVKFYCDNGRVLECSGKFITYVTQYDLEIILRQYKYKKCYVLFAFKAIAKPLPDWFLKKIDEYYKYKTDLKKRVKYLKSINAPRDDVYEAEIRLIKSKNFLNGLYGLTAMDFCKADFVRDDNGNINPAFIDYQKKIDDNYGIYRNKEHPEKYYTANTSTGFLPYYWSVFITACARYELFKYIDICGDNFIYCDTDSIYYIYDEKIEKEINALNEKKYKNAIVNGLYITDSDGNKITYDSFDLEDTGTQFRFLHSKCYAYVSKNQLNVTISGVANRRLIDVKDGKPNYFYSSDELQTIKNLKDDFVFKVCGSTKAQYKSVTPDFYNVGNGKTEYCADFVIISENEKTLSIGNDDFILNYYNETIEKGLKHA